MWITSDVDIVRCIASACEPLPQTKAVVRSYCPAFFRARACSKTQQRVAVSFSLSNFYITEFLFAEMKISVSWHCLLLINIVAVTVLKILFCAELFTMAEPKYSPCPESVQCTYSNEVYGGRAGQHCSAPWCTQDKGWGLIHSRHLRTWPRLCHLYFL